jgi:hypothetical protein
MRDGDLRPGVAGISSAGRPQLDRSLSRTQPGPRRCVVASRTEDKGWANAR